MSQAGTGKLMYSVIPALLHVAKPKPEEVMQMVHSKDCFGIVWFIFYGLKKGIVQLPFDVLDFSKSDLPASKVFYLLSFLPSETKEVILGDQVHGQRAFTLLRRFLEGKDMERSPRGTRRRLQRQEGGWRRRQPDLGETGVLAEPPSSSLRKLSLGLKASHFVFEKCLEKGSLLRRPLEKIELRLNSLSTRATEALCEGRLPFSTNLILRLESSQASVGFVNACKKTETDSLPVAGVHLDFGQVLPSKFPPLPKNLKGCLRSVSVSLGRMPAPGVKVNRWFSHLTSVEIREALDGDLENLVESIDKARLSRFKKLILTNATVTREGFEALVGPESPGLPKLLHLEVSETRESSPFLQERQTGTMKALMRGLADGKCPLIRTLNFCKGKVRRESLNILTEAVRLNRLPCLEVLDLENNWVTSTDVINLMAALTPDSLPDFHFLNLVGTGVAELGGRALGEAMNNGRLQRLRKSGRLLLGVLAANGFRAVARDTTCLHTIAGGEVSG